MQELRIESEQSSNGEQTLQIISSTVSRINFKKVMDSLTQLVVTALTTSIIQDELQVNTNFQTYVAQCKFDSFAHPRHTDGFVQSVVEELDKVDLRIPDEIHVVFDLIQQFCTEVKPKID